MHPLHFPQYLCILRKIRWKIDKQRESLKPSLFSIQKKSIWYEREWWITVWMKKEFGSRYSYIKSLLPFLVLMKDTFCVRNRNIAPFVEKKEFRSRTSLDASRRREHLSKYLSNRCSFFSYSWKTLFEWENEFLKNVNVPYSLKVLAVWFIQRVKSLNRNFDCGCVVFWERESWNFNRRPPWWEHTTTTRSSSSLIGDISSV